MLKETAATTKLGAAPPTTTAARNAKAVVRSKVKTALMSTLRCE